MSIIEIDARRPGDPHREWEIRVFGPPHDASDALWLAYSVDWHYAPPPYGPAYRGTARVVAGTLARAKGAAIRHFRQQERAEGGGDDA